MLPLIPKEISKKIEFWDNDVFVQAGVILTEEEQKIFDDFRQNLSKNNKARFEN